jgi:hypothetical protein
MVQYCSDCAPIQFCIVLKLFIPTPLQTYMRQFFTPAFTYFFASPTRNFQCTGTALLLCFAVLTETNERDNRTSSQSLGPEEEANSTLTKPVSVEHLKVCIASVHRYIFGMLRDSSRSIGCLFRDLLSLFLRVISSMTCFAVLH